MRWPFLLLAILADALLLQESGYCANLDATFYPKPDFTAGSYSGKVIEITASTNLVEGYKAGFRFAELGIMEVEDRGIEGTISIEPFKYKLREECGQHGANAFILHSGYIVNRNTDAFMKISATLYRVERREELVEFFSEYALTFSAIAAALDLDERLAEATSQLEASQYAAQRTTVIDSALRDAIAEKFALELPSEYPWKEVDIVELPAGSRESLEKFLGRIVADGTLGEAIAKDQKSFDDLARALRLKRLRELSEKYPKDFADFRRNYAIVNGKAPEEAPVKKPNPKK